MPMQHVSPRLLLLAAAVIVTVLPARAQWKSIRPPGVGHDLWSISFATPDLGYVIGSAPALTVEGDTIVQSVIARTSDGGKTWTTKVYDRMGLNSVSFPTPGTSYFAGFEYINHRSIIIQVDEATQTSTILQSPVQHYPWFSTAFLSATTGFVAGGDFNGLLGSTIEKTTNGRDWKVVAQGSDIFSTLFFLDTTTGFVTAGPPSGDANKLYGTTDGGESWGLIHDFGPDAVLSQTAFVSRQIGYVVGFPVGDYSTGFIDRTTDGGATWTEQLQTDAPLGAIDFADAQTGYVAGLYGRLLRTTNGGETWMDESLASGAPILCLDAASPSVAYAAGASGSVFKRAGVTSAPAEIATGSGVRIFPNPFTDAATLRIDGARPDEMYTITVYDMLGRELLQREAAGGVARIERGELGSGVYAFTVRNGTVMRSGTLVAR